MKYQVVATLALVVLFSCLSCEEFDPNLGGSLVPINQTYKVYSTEAPINTINMRMADSLSGYSSERITIGAIKDSEYGTTTRSCALTLVPLRIGDFDLGKDPKFKRMFMQVALDTCSVADPSQERIFQNINVYELARPIKAKRDFDCNATVPHKDERISEGRPIYNRGDSLTIFFNEDFGNKFLSLEKEDFEDINKYFEKFPGIYLDTDAPKTDGGRINIFELQLDLNTESYYIAGNYASLLYEAEYDGVRKDSTVLFLLGAYSFNQADSLFSGASKNTVFPQYCFNYTGHETRAKEGKASEKIEIEGGGGLKPVIPANELKAIAEEMIAATGNDPKKAVINKASIELPFEFPEDYRIVDRLWPDYLSPTCRVLTDTTATFSSLSDSSNKDENLGDIDRSLCRYAPDITYHLQQILRIDESDTESKKTQQYLKGMYDVWLLIMANEVDVQYSETNKEMSEYYNYLAYQSYYGNMYGGYGGYGGYGYGGYNNYNNYYNYMMMAQYASQSSSYEKTSVELDKDRFYKATINGPSAASNRVPKLKLIFSVANDE